MNKLTIKREFLNILGNEFLTSPDHATDEQLYKSLCMMVRRHLEEEYRRFTANANSNGRKKVYYLCMEFLIGRSLKSSLYNLGIVEDVEEILKEEGIKLENLYEQEPDAGLGNGGLGRLAACFLHSLASLDYPATGYSICYEFGIFKQKIIDGWQTELPDDWLPGGSVWLEARPEEAVSVKFGGHVDEFWDQGYHHVNYKEAETVKAVPYDMYLSGYDCKAVSLLRQWKAESPGFDMELFNRGDYVSAMSKSAQAEAISKVLYPNDNHIEGKKLRLRQQYFMVAASMGDIVAKHLATYGTFDNLHEKVAIHINDTHPTLAIPELMRILLDDCGYTWERAWDIVSKTFAYTNHTVMSEALEKWNEDIFEEMLPRIYQIIKEIDRRFCAEVFDKTQDLDKVSRMSIVAYHQVRMANLCVVGSHKVNGVSKLHSEIIKESVFKDFYDVYPEKFTNVTNGIAYRRWLCQANPALTSMISSLIGDGFKRDANELANLMKYKDDAGVLEELAKVKRHNKEEFAKHILDMTGVVINTDSIFDVHVKRLHEYKRQHMNALHILSLYRKLLEDPDADITPRTFIFGAKAAPGYYMAKQIIKLICTIGKEIERNPVLKDKIRIVYLEDYRVTLSELLMPASEVSEQISLASTEASGTGNMKLMLSGAITLGTLDGANVEIREAVGDDNIVIFGMTTPQVQELQRRGYHPVEIYNSNPEIHAIVDMLDRGIGGENFSDIASMLRNTDTYMALADFESYQNAHQKIQQLYADQKKWQQMSLINIAQSGRFSSDNAIKNYANNIWNL